MMLLRVVLFFVGSLLLVFLGCQEKNSSSLKNPVFEIMEAAHTNINFSNELHPDVATKFNLLDFDYYYNGAGVGVGDFDNDGLQDLFFAGNESENKLYINKGDFVFEDISEQARINQGKHWSSGVSIVDINADGWVDIYISQGGPHESSSRHNLLYINNKNLTFTERAKEYGLDDSGISTQSAFFDYDKDGDLDCIVMNESLVYGYDPSTFHRLLLENADQVYESYSHFYKNEDGKFIDVTVEAGITAPTFGLGLVVSDINADGWLDIYIANDYYQPDNVYINRQNGTFSDRSKIHLKQTSFYGMGADIADINNDGHQDIFVLDMASKDHIRAKTLMASMDIKSFDLLVNKFKFLHQYMYNSLQLNDGNGRFNNISQMSGVANTDWSWASILEDFNQDGYRDIFVTNGYRQYGTDNDFKRRVTEAKKKYNNMVPLSVKKELYESMPTEPLANRMFKNNKNLSFSQVGDQWGLELPTYSNGAATADLDNDGDLDLIINNMDQVAGIYKNTSSESGANYLNVQLSEPLNAYAKVYIYYGDDQQFAEIKRVRGYMSSLQPIAHFGLGTIKVLDKVKVVFPNGKVWSKENVKANQLLTIDILKAKDDLVEEKRNPTKISVLPAMALGLNYKNKENSYNDFSKEVLLPYKQSTRGPRMAVTDLNDDGADDLFIGAPSGQVSELYISDGGQYKKISVPAFITDVAFEDSGAVFFDYDQDGDQDLMVLNGGNEYPEGHPYYIPRIYINEGGLLFSKLETVDLIPYASCGGTVVTLDYDQDGDDDLLIGGRIIAQKYPMAARSYLLRNDGGRLMDVSAEVIPGLEKTGIINDIKLIDLDDDGDQDIVMAQEWDGILIFENNGGEFVITNSVLTEQYRGLFFSITPTDINGDGKPDFIVGNIGKNYKLSASIKKPLMVYAADLDDNGTHDLVLSKKYKNNYVPVRGRECSSQQMPMILDKFETYEKFANSSLIDIYGDEHLAKAYTRSITTTRSYVFINKGNMKFEVVPLPNLAQSFPIMAVTSTDLNNDGKQDLICMGTIYDTEVETPRLDAGSGIVFLSTGENYVIGGDEYSFYIDGDIKSSLILNGLHGKPYMVVGRKNKNLGLVQF